MQIEAEKEGDDDLPSLVAYCPDQKSYIHGQDFYTLLLSRYRRVSRIKSLKTVRDNYILLTQFFHDRCVDKDVGSAIATKASGFFDYMESFECMFYFSNF